jgi:TRAP-type C4-dicarboxylate transport system substrate-binding protein
MTLSFSVEPPVNRKRAAVALTALCTLALASVVSRPARAQTVVIKMATIVPKNSVWDTALGDMAADFKKDSGGLVEVKIYAGSVQGDDADVVRKMKGGVLGGSLLSGAGLHIIDHGITALTIPMMFDNYDEVYGVLETMRPEYEKAAADQGFIILSWADAGFVHFLTTEPVKTPDDLRKLKIFTWQDDSSGATDLWKSAGFTAVPLPSTEITSALETGLITALPTASEPASLMQWNQHAKYMLDINWGILLGAVVITKDKWDKIPPDIQVKLRADAIKAGAALREGTRKTDAAAVQAMKDHGLIVTEPDLPTWRAVVEPSWAKLRGGLVPVEEFDKVKAARDAWRTTHPVKKADAK